MHRLHNTGKAKSFYLENLSRDHPGMLCVLLSTPTWRREQDTYQLVVAFSILVHRERCLWWLSDGVVLSSGVSAFFLW